MSIPEKIKSSIHICCLDRNKKFNIELHFEKDYFSIFFLEPLKPEFLKEVKEIFTPFLSKNNRQIKINYTFIKTIYTDNLKLLKFTLYDPLSISILTIIFNHLKYKKSIIFTEVSLPPAILSSIALDINKKLNSQIEKKIQDYINIIYILYQFTGTERKYDEIIDNFFIKAFIFGKNYYDKTLKDFTLKNKINQNSMSLETAKQINKYISEMKLEKENKTKTNIIEQIRKVNKSSSSIEEEDENEEDEKHKKKNTEFIDKILVNIGMDNSEYNPSMFLALDIDSNNKRDLFQNYEKLKKYESDLRIKTSYFTEITINLIFKLFNVDKNDLNNKYNFMNKTAIGYRININTNSLQPKYDITQTNYQYGLGKKSNDDYNNNSFKNKNTYNDIHKFMKKYYSDEPNINKDNDKYINELLEFSKKFHSFVPNNSVQNIIDNSSQIIQRKFFELLLKHFFSDIMDIEVEKNKFLSSDAFHEILLVLRRLKKLLFVNKNMNYFNEFLFLNEQ